MPNLAVEKEWGGGSVPIKFSAWYDCARDPGGQATYALYVQIKPLSSSWWFGYPINVSAEIRVDNGTWQTLLWPNSATSWMFKDKSPLNWSADIQYNTQNKLITATPGQNVQIKLRIYSNGASDVVDRDKTFTWSNLIVPQMNASQIVSITNLSVARNSTATISANIYNGSNIHNLKVYAGNVLVAERGKGTSSSMSWSGSGNPLSYTFQLTGTESTTIRNAMPNSATGMLTYTLTTYDPTGTTVLGSSSKQGSCSIPSTVLPSFSESPTFTPVYSEVVPASVVSTGKYIQGLTSLRVSATATAAGGASIAYYEVTVGAVTQRTPSLPTDVPLNEPGTSLGVSVKVYDTRGRFTERSASPGTVSVFEYSAPKIETYASYRCTGSGVDSPDGTYFKAKLATAYSPMSDYCVLTIPNPGAEYQAWLKYTDEAGVEHKVTTSGSQQVPWGSTVTLYLYGYPDASGRNTIYLQRLGESTESAYAMRLGSPATLDWSANANATITFDLSNIYNAQIHIVESSEPTNPITLTYRYKPSTSGESGWITPSPNVVNMLGEYSEPLGGSLEATASYDVEYTISDLIYTNGISVIDYVSSGQFTLFLAKGGNAVSVGEVYSPAEGSDEKVLNVAEDWVINRGGQPAVREDSSGWVIHDLGGGYIEMWGEINCTVSGWTQWGSSNVYYSSARFNKDYPYSITFDGAPFVTATVRTYYTDSTHHPNLWLVADAQSSVNTESNQTETTPDYVLARIGTLPSDITAKIAVHVMGKPVISS